MAKRSLYFIIAIISLVLFHGCTKDSTVGATFSVNIYAVADTALVNGSPNYVAINNTYFDAKGYKYSPSTFKFYVSHLSLIKEDNTLQNVNTIALADFTNLYLGQPVVISGNVPSGKYKGIKFWLGVDSVLNNKGPLTDYAETDPLSVYQGNYWTWHTGYRFIIFEGLTDTIRDNTGTPSYKAFEYHTGTNPLYTEVDFPESNITVAAYQNTAFNINLDVNHIFYSAGDTLTVYKQNYTQTTDNYPLAQQVTKNLSQAFSQQ